jgi:hypothetical protein
MLRHLLLTLAAGAGPLAADPGEGRPGPVPRVEVVAGVIKSVRPKVDIIVVTVAEGDQRTDRTIGLEGGAKLLFARRPAALADLRPGMHVELAYKGNSADLLEVRASWPRREVVFRSADPDARTFRVAAGGAEAVLKLAPDASVVVDELPAGLADVPVGQKVRIDPTADETGVLALEADGPPDTLPGLVKRYDAAARTLFVEVRAAGFRFDRVATIGFPVAAGAKVRYAGRDAALADLTERMPVRLTFAADRRAVASVLAAAPLPPEVNDDD